MIRFVPLLLAFLALNAFAATPEEIDNSKFEFVPIEGSLRLVFKDGREAELYNRVSGTSVLPLKMKMSETLNSANPVPTNCVLQVPVEFYAPTFVWTKHSDPSRVGKRVMLQKKSKTQPDFLVEDTNNYFLSIEEKQRAGSNRITTPMLFGCGDFQWLTGTQTTRAEGFLIDTWGAEINVINFETGVNENQTFNGGFNIALKAVDAQTYAIERGLFFSIFNIAALISTGPSNLVYRDATGAFTQSTFSVDAGPINQEASRLLEIAKASAPSAIAVSPQNILSVRMGLSALKKFLDEGRDDQGVIP